MIVSRTQKREHCVLAFFGIDRRLDITAPTIHTTVVRPASHLFEVSAAGYLWRPRFLNNRRTAEAGKVHPPRLDLLPRGNYHVEEPLVLEENAEFLRLRSFGDFWHDDFASLGNLYSQLVSLKRLTRMVLAAEPDCAIFLRPDLLYHDSIEPALKKARNAGREGIALPHWQPHGGLNDRFAVCFGPRAIRAYGERLDSAVDFCVKSSGPLHSERLLRFAVSRANIPVRRVSTRASRVRLDGSSPSEDFSYRGWVSDLRVAAGFVRRELRHLLPARAIR